MIKKLSYEQFEKLRQRIEKISPYGTLLLFLPGIVSLFLLIATILNLKLFTGVVLGIMLAMIPLPYFLYKVFSEYFETRKKKRNLFGLLLPIAAFIFYILVVGSIVLDRRFSGIDLKLLSIMAVFFSLVLTVVIPKTDRAVKIQEELLSAKTLSEQFGFKEYRTGDAILCNSKEEVEAGAKDSRVIIPYKDRFLHMLILGATGTGKTTQMLLPLITQDIQNTEAGVIIIDPKGDLAQKAKFIAEHYGRDAKYFDPSMEDCPKFNPLAGYEVDVEENIATTFRMLMPDSATYFLDISEQLVRNSIKVLKRLDRAEGIEGMYANLITMSALVQNSGGRGRELISKFQKIDARNSDEASQNNEIASWFLNDYYPERSKIYENTSGVRSQVSKLCANEFLRSVLNPDVTKGEKNDIDFDRCLAEGEVFCISTSQGALRGLSRFLGYFLILQLQSAVFRRPGNEDTRRACFLYIDEFQNYSTPGFADMLTMGRSYRVASHLATQARSQMEMGSGRDGKDFVNLVSTNARNVVLFPGCSYDDALYYSNQFGKHEEVEVIKTRSERTFNPLQGGMSLPGHGSESTREQRKEVENITPTDIMYRDFGEITYSIIQRNTLQHAGFGFITYIDKDLNEEADRKIAEYVANHKKKRSDELDSEERDDSSGDMIIWDDGTTTSFDGTQTTKEASDIVFGSSEEEPVPDQVKFKDLIDEEDEILAEEEEDIYRKALGM